MNIENISILILLHTTRHTVRGVSCPSLLLMAFVAFSAVPQDMFMLICMKLNLFSSLDLLITSKLNPSDQPSSWAVPEVGNSFLRQGRRMRRPQLPSVSSPRLQQQTHNSSSFCSSSLLSAAWHLACFIYSSLFREAFHAFHAISPRFWLCSMGKEAKYNSKSAWWENSKASADKKKEKWYSVVACMDFWNGDLHTFFIYKILFLLYSFTRNVLAVKNILGLPEKNKINDLCNLTVSVTQKEKSIFFLLLQNQTTSV